MPDLELRRKLERALPAFAAWVGEEDDDGLVEGIVEVGLDRPLAWRIAAFLPVAFTRAFFSKSKVQFADTFVRVKADGTAEPERRLDEEPVYREALSLARTMAGSQAMLPVAIRSPAFRALNQAMRQGLKLENLGVAPAVLYWPEN